MKTKQLLKALCLCTVVLWTSTACIDTRYDLSNLSMKFALGGDSLSIPLVSNGSIVVGEVLGDSIELITTDPSNGGYVIEMCDSVSYSLEDLGEVGNIGIEDQIFEPDPFEVEGIDASATKITIPGMSEKESFALDINGFDLDKFELPGIGINQPIQVKFSDISLTDEQKRLDIEPIDIEQGGILNNINLPDELKFLANNLPHQEIPLILPDNVVNIEASNSLALTIPTPKGLENIGDIVLKKTPATMTVSIQLENANQFFTSGTIAPNLSITPTNIFEFESSDNVVDGKIIFGNGDVMDKNNLYTINKTVNINRLNVNGKPSDEGLSINDMVEVLGNITLSDFKYYADEIETVKNLKFKMSVAFNDMIVENMSFEIAGQSTSNQGQSDISLNVELPEQINALDKLVTQANSSIVFNIAGNSSLSGLKDNLMFKSFHLRFPKAFKFADMAGLDQSTNTYSLDNTPFNPEQGLQLSFELQEVDMSEFPVSNGTLAWKDQVSYDVELLIHGKINSSAIPSSDVEFAIAATSDLKVEDAFICVNEIEQTLEGFNFAFKEDVASPMDELKSINTATLEDNIFLNIDLGLPQLSLPIVAKNIRIALPKMIVFAEHPNLNSDNVYTINGPMPENISLQLKQLNINKDFENGVLSLSDSIVMNGAVAIDAGTIGIKELSDATKEDITVDFSINDMVIENIGASIKGISYPVHDSICFEESFEIPKEIVDVDSILLDEGALINLSLLAENLPKLGNSPIKLTFSIDLPDVFMLESNEINKDNNIWRFDSELIDGQSIDKTISIKGLDLSHFHFDGKLDLSEEIRYDINVYIAEADINSDDLVSNEPIKISSKVELKGLNLSKVYGRVDPMLDPMDISVDLSGLPEMLKDSNNVSLEINPVIELSAKSNISIPLVIDGEMTPVIDETHITDRTQSLHIEIPKAESPEEERTHHFWIAANDFDMPQGYQFVQININDILKSIPDSIAFKLNVGTDLDIQHEFDLNAAYAAGLQYKIHIPLSFGENTKFSIKDTMEMDLSEIGGYFDYVGEFIELFGEIENSIPLNLTAHLYALDEDKNIVEMDPVSLGVRAGNSDGSACVSPVSIKLNNKNHQLDKVKFFLLDFKLRSDANVANTPISPNDYIHAKLKLKVVGGLVIDANEL